MAETIWSHRLAVRTPGFHPGNRGSIPLGITIENSPGSMSGLFSIGLALEQNPSRYDMRVNDTGEFTDAGDPYCTTCSRLTLESGIGEFALWNRDGADIYGAPEYNQKSYDYFVAT
jgi:hypothetical protein